MHILINKSHLLNYNFYLRDPAKVAKELLGKLLVRKLGNNILIGRVVETEAYFGSEDPASRAYKGVNKISELMFGKPGRLLVYVVHANNLVNVVAHNINNVGAVLIRALEPIYGLDIMKSNRNTNKDVHLCSGPGKLTQALCIERAHHGLDITNRNSEIVLIDNKEKFDIQEAFRIGVKKDLAKRLRFFIKDNKFVSR
ncbi:DNA-3-methyladenine glycosylase [Candidatus Pacearchaeota archaeon]|nr:DNA-3-methyladenine glycosylase [Candidatus Pacearchaeota archaeon]